MPCLGPVLVVVPTLDEVESIRACLLGVLGCGVAVDVLVVDDLSADGTAGEVLSVALGFPGRVFLLSREGPPGLGAAYRAGFAWALERGYGVVVQMDADGSHPASVLPAMLAALAGPGVGLVLASRYVAGGATSGWPFRRRVLSAGANLFARRLLGLSQRDVTSGFRAWRGDVLARCSWGSSDGFGSLVQMLASACWSGFSVVEVPFTFVDRRAGCSKMGLSVVLGGFRAVCAVRSSRGAVLVPSVVS